MWAVEVGDPVGDYSEVVFTDDEELDDVTEFLEAQRPGWVVLNVWKDEEG